MKSSGMSQARSHSSALYKQIYICITTKINHCQYTRPLLYWVSMSKLPTVAIVGQTNVGKSSLFNRLYGSQEAIVAREAGTTRDNVVRRITLDDRTFWLVDTAGLKSAEDEFEASIQD